MAAVSYGRAPGDENDEIRAAATGALRLFVAAARHGEWGSAWGFACLRKGLEVRMVPELLKSSNDPILDARALRKGNTERTAEEIAVLLVRLGWSADVANSAARVAAKGG